MSFVNNIIDAFDVGEHQTRVGFVTFSSDATLTFPMNSYYYPEALKQAVLSINYVGGETDTGKAMYITRTQCFSEKYGERDTVPNIAILITDGLPTVAAFDTFNEASLLKQHSSVLAVGITKSVEARLLREISSFPQKENENYFLTPDFSNLRNILNVLITETCQAPLKTTPSPSQDRISPG